MRLSTDERGQVMILVMLLMGLLMATIPILVRKSQDESRWTVKHQQSNNAFHLAEAAVERGFRKIIESTGTWNQLQDTGTPFSGFNFDVLYNDLSGGDYAISISSGPDDQQVTIIGVGRETNSGQTRGIIAVYTNALFSDTAIWSNGALEIGGNNFNVELGGVIDPISIDPDDRTHPQFHSAGNVIGLDTNGNATPNCDSPDCVWWWSYQDNLPPTPEIDLDFYESSATATGTYFVGDMEFAGSYITGYTYYVTGNVNQAAPGNHKTYIKGNLIVLGNLTTPTGAWSSVDVAGLTVPPNAWKQYGGDWAFYRSEFDSDSSSPASFPGLDSDYEEIGETYTADTVFVEGFLYVGGNLTSSGGAGNGSIVGAIYIEGETVLAAGSNANVYYNKEISSQIKSTSINLNRSSWRETIHEWPSGL